MTPLTDKKLCLNCGDQGYTQNCEGRSLEDSACKNWIRNPYKWLSILPTEEGWYWWRGYKGAPCLVLKLLEGDQKQLWTMDCVDYNLFEAQKLGGQWQGPINPKGD